MTISDRRRRPLWTAFAAALAGIAMLTAWFPRFWPAAKWPVLPRVEDIAKGRQIAQHFGLSVNDWKMSAVPIVSKSLTYHRQQHPEDPNVRDLSPLTLKLEFSEKKGDGEAETVVDSTGLPIRWRAPHGFKPSQHFASDDLAANEAFHFFAGAQASAFGAPSQASEDGTHQQTYVWKKLALPGSDIKERIQVVTQDSVVRSAERTVDLPSGSDDDDSDTGSNQGYWDFLAVLFGLFCTSVSVAIVGIYVLWLVRRVVSHSFPLRISIAALCVMGAGLAAKIAKGTLDAGDVFSALFLAASILCVVVVGRGISAESRSKWLSLEQLCFLAPIGKSTGDSLAAGVLFSPLLAAIPFLIAACGLFPHSSVLVQNGNLLYSPVPLIDSFRVSADLYLLGFFGFGLPALHRLTRFHWLFWLIALPVGVVFFADMVPAVSGPLIAPLTAGLCTLAIYWFVYRSFDLLAVLTLQFGGTLVLTFSMLKAKGLNTWSSTAAFVCLLAAAWWFAKRGQTVSAGDPLATIPALADFRAEREKLKAEFSVARRAQQDMLPRIPPSIPGYSIAASCTPSLEVGGDLYDFLKLPDGRIGIGVADVSGKGVPAALYMTLTKGLLASVSKNNAQLATVVEEVNRHLHGVTRKKVFVTMALGFLDAEKGVLECVRAGHNPMVWRQTARNLTTLVAPGGLGLGITAGRVFGIQLKVAEMVLTEGDAVVFYSDGITEAMNSGLEQFGEQRLMDAVEKADHLDAAGARDFILGSVREFLDGVHPQDDMTLVVLRVGVLH